jgi:hypothetical protein
MSPSALLLIVAILGSLTACDATRGQRPVAPQPAASLTLAPSLLQRGLDAYERGDFAQAMEFFERAHAETPLDQESAFQLARAWVRNDRTLEAEDLVGDLLLSAPETFRRRVQAEPAFDSDGFLELLRTAGASSLPPSDLPTAQFDVDGDGALETFVVSQRVTRNESFLATIARTSRGPVAHRLVDVAPMATRLTAFRTEKKGCAVLVEGPGGSTVQAELHVVSEATSATPKVIYGKRFVLDGGDGDEPPPVDGALWFSVIDVIVGGEPELVFTFIDPRGEPRGTMVLDINGGRATELGEAGALRQEAAQRLRSGRRSLPRSLAEALVRLEPESTKARRTLLEAVDTPTSAEWWGFYPPGSNDFIGLHSAYIARHATAQELAALAAVPNVASFLARWSLTPEQLGEQSEPLVPPSGLWGRAHFLESTDVSTAFSYFRLE